ncbi:hypothetical protein [Nocardia iowensis]|uniref:hypothetical protein n=1 Tax=Nocardia iowensis TaxID=204891 RepID=UPI0031F149C2
MDRQVPLRDVIAAIARATQKRFAPSFRRATRGYPTEETMSEAPLATGARPARALLSARSGSCIVSMTSMRFGRAM